MRTNSREKPTTLCRTCLLQINNFSRCYSLENQESNDSVTLRYKLSQCIPELHLDTIPGTMICNDCFIAVNSIYDFKNKCLQTEQMIKTFLGGMFSIAAFVEFIQSKQVQKTPSKIVDSGLLNENSQRVNVKVENRTDIRESTSLHCQNVATNDVTNAQIQQMQAADNIKAENYEYTEESDVTDMQIQERSVEMIEVDSSDYESETSDNISFEERTSKNPNITNAQSEPKQNENNLEEFNIESNHELFNYGSNPQHQCTMCNYICGTEESLTNHVVNYCIAHTSKRMSKNFGNLHNRNSSVNSKHYECVTCGKQILSLEAIISHVRTHLPKKQKKCDSCNYGTDTKAKLKKHKKFRHPKRTQKCPHCNVAYLKQIHLNRHIKKKHKNIQIEPVSINSVN